MKGLISEIDIEKISLKDTTRDKASDLTTLQMSINSIGLLSPIIVDKNNILITGFRRLQACKNLNMQKITALKFDIDYRSMMALNIQSDENLCREALSPEEIEKLIAKKQSAASDKGYKGRFSIIGFIKRLLGLNR